MKMLLKAWGYGILKLKGNSRVMAAFCVSASAVFESLVSRY